MKTGFIVGKFAPLTTGHVHFINESAKHCDKLLVLLSFDEKWLKSQIRFFRETLTLENRLRWLNETFKHNDKIIVDYVDESELRPAPEGWGDFSMLVRERISDRLAVDHCDYTFTSEPSYDEGFKTHFPKTKHVLIDPDRSEVGISATEVRESMTKHWHYMPEAVQDYYR